MYPEQESVVASATGVMAGGAIKPSELAREINRGLEGGELLLKQLTMLEQRLSPVLRAPVPSPEKDGVDPAPMTDIARSVSMIGGKVNQASTIVRSILSRLEV